MFVVFEQGVNKVFAEGLISAASGPIARNQFGKKLIVINDSSIK